MSKIFPGLNKRPLHPVDNLKKNKVAQAVRKTQPVPEPKKELQKEVVLPSLGEKEEYSDPENQIIMSEAMSEVGKQVGAHGYSTLCVKDKFYYTAGFGIANRPDLFALSLAPFSVFQLVAGMYHRNEIEENKPFLVPEFKIRANGLEPARVKLQRLSPEDDAFVRSKFATMTNYFTPNGILVVHFPDNNNRLYGEEPYLIKRSPMELLQDLLKEKVETPA
jgi:hypothetical protein